MIVAQNLCNFCQGKLERNDIVFFLQIIEIILKIPRRPNAGGAGGTGGKEFVKVLGGNKKAFKTIIIIIPS